jgi:hypothetical protein
MDLPMSGSDLILFAHPTFGVLAILSSVWVFVEALNAPGNTNGGRTFVAAVLVAVFMFAAYVLGGYWYVTYYAAEKAIILKGPWPWAHDLMMETKEHLFFIPLILALFLPIAAAGRLAAGRGARRVVMVVSALIVLNGLAIEGAGAMINAGVKVAFVHTGVKGAEQ